MNYDINSLEKLGELISANQEKIKKIFENEEINKYFVSENLRGAIKYAIDNYYSIIGGYSRYYAARLLLDFYCYTNYEDDPDIVNKLYTEMVNHWIDGQMDSSTICELMYDLCFFVNEFIIEENCERQNIYARLLVNFLNINKIEIRNEKTKLVAVESFNPVTKPITINTDKANATWASLYTRIYLAQPTIDWPDSATEIPPYAFSGNKTLKKIKIPKTVTKIGLNAFEACSDDLVIEMSKKNATDCAEQNVDFLQKHIKWK